jgi:Ser/Thr protein kinase RdoA (MazF antagonist)
VPGDVDLGGLTDDAIDAWCGEALGSGVDAVLFRAGHLARVTGVRLDDGREVVVKVRRHEPRLAGCAGVQRRLWEAGFPCPRPLAGPAPLLGYAASAEAFVPGGEMLPASAGAAADYAGLLARLVALAPAASVAPNPPWVAWDHGEDGVWPAPDDRAEDLNAHPGPAWLDEVGARVRRRLRRMPARRPVVGHGDWEAQNLRWQGREPWVVHDWDSVVSAPEPLVAGLAASVWPCGAEPRAATVSESAAFTRAYQAVAGRRFSRDEVEEGWAAGLWVYAFNAKKASLDGETWLSRDEADERLRLAGA